MGLFDRMFGKGASKEKDKNERFNELKGKYSTVLGALEQQKVQLRNLHVQDNKLYLRGIAPSEAARNAIWDQIKLVDADYDDLIADITVQPGATNGAANGTANGATAKTYTVKAGDTLSEISQAQYGDPNEYMRIFYANRDKLSDPDEIQVGQQLVIPPDDDQ